MTYLSDKRRTEIAYLSELITAVTISCTSNPEVREDATAMAKLPSAGLEDKKVKSLRNRVVKLIRKTLMTIPNKTDGEKVVIITYCLLNLLSESGVIETPPESPAGLIMDWLLSDINSDNEVTQSRLKTGNKTATKWLTILQQEGYFNG